MRKEADYIKRIEITGLWGRRNIVWNLHSDVNILAGINGIGKSTIINMAVKVLITLSGLPVMEDETKGIKITFEPEECNSILFSVIRSFDRPLLHAELLEKLADNRVKTELDWQLYQLQRQYLDYQVNVGNRMIELLQNPDIGMRQKAMDLSKPKVLFQDIIDELFHDTKKAIDRKSNEIILIQAGDRLEPYQLSSGEKQVLVIMLTALIQNFRHYAFLMDEPDVALHLEWQKKLIGLVRKLNPNAQIILTTHSPALIMNGWLDRVTEVSDISDDPLIDKEQDQ